MKFYLSTLALISMFFLGAGMESLHAEESDSSAAANETLEDSRKLDPTEIKTTISDATKELNKIGVKPSSESDSTHEITELLEHYSELDSNEIKDVISKAQSALKNVGLTPTPINIIKAYLLRDSGPLTKGNFAKKFAKLDKIFKSKKSSTLTELNLDPKEQYAYFKMYTALGFKNITSKKIMLTLEKMKGNSLSPAQMNAIGKKIWAFSNSKNSKFNLSDLDALVHEEVSKGNKAEKSGIGSESPAQGDTNAKGTGSILLSLGSENKENAASFLEQFSALGVNERADLLAKAQSELKKAGLTPTSDNIIKACLLSGSGSFSKKKFMKVHQIFKNVEAHPLRGLNLNPREYYAYFKMYTALGFKGVTSEKIMLTLEKMKKNNLKLVQINAIGKKIWDDPKFTLSRLDDLVHEEVSKDKKALPLLLGVENKGGVIVAEAPSQGAVITNETSSKEVPKESGSIPLSSSVENKGSVVVAESPSQEVITNAPSSKEVSKGKESLPLNSGIDHNKVGVGAENASVQGAGSSNEASKESKDSGQKNALGKDETHPKIISHANTKDALKDKATHQMKKKKFEDAQETQDQHDETEKKTIK